MEKINELIEEIEKDRGEYFCSYDEDAGKTAFHNCGILLQIIKELIEKLKHNNELQ